MRIIGLTGGIASGKSTISAELRRLGIPVFDADQASRDAVARGSEGLAQVAAALGQDCLTDAGELDRARVSQLVFRDENARRSLERVIHRIVWEQAELFLRRAREQHQSLAVLDVPLLIETGWHKRVDSVWLVAVSRRQQIERAMARSGMTEAEVTARIEAQMSLGEKRRYADVVLDNSGSLENTLNALHTELAKLAGEHSGR